MAAALAKKAEAPAKKTAPKKPQAKPRPKAKAHAAHKAWRAKWPATSKIKLLTEENPHRVGTKDRKKWSKLVHGETVEGAKGRGVDLGYLRYAAGRGLIEVTR